MKITTQALKEMPKHIALKTLCDAAGLKESTIRSKVKDGRELSDRESELLSAAFGPYCHAKDVEWLLEAAMGFLGGLYGLESLEELEERVGELRDRCEAFERGLS